MKSIAFAKRSTSTLVLFVVFLFTALVIGYFGSRVLASSLVSSKKTVVCDSCVYILENGFSKAEIAIRENEYIEFVTADGNRHNLALGSGLDKHHNDVTTTMHEDDHVDSDEHHNSTTSSASSHSQPHDHNGGTESGEFGEGEAWKVQFKQKGTYMVHDHLYPDHAILVVVY